MDMIWLQPALLAFLLAATLIAAASYASSRYARKGRGSARSRTYSCGEAIRPSAMSMPESSLLGSLVRSLGIQKLSEWHSGELSRYMIWIFAGMLIIILWLLLMW